MKDDFFKEFEEQHNTQLRNGIFGFMGCGLLALVINVGLFIGMCLIVKWIFF